MEILTLARELGHAVQQSEEYIDFRIKEQNVECDAELQKEIEEFNLKKVSINRKFFLKFSYHYAILDTVGILYVKHRLNL